MILTGKNVSWEEEGDYYVDYYDPGIKAEIRQNIIITNSEALKKGITNLIPDIETTIPGVGANGFLLCSDQSFFLYGEIYTGEIPYQTQDRYVFPYLAYFENGIKAWEQIFDPDHYGSFSDACLTENGIALIGQKDSPGQGKNVIVYELGCDKKILFQKELSGSQDDFGLKIFYERGNFYIIGSSASDDYDYYGFGSESRDVYVGILSRDKSIAIYPLRLEGRDELLDGIYYNGRFYVLAEFASDTEKKQKLLVLEKDNILKSYDFGRFGKNCDFKMTRKNNELLIAVRNDTEKLYYLCFDSNLNLLSENRIDFSEPLRDYRLLSGFETYFVFITGKVGKECLRIARLKSDGNCEFVKEVKRPNLDRVIGFGEDQTGTVKLCSSGNPGEILIYDFQHFRLEENRTESESGAFTENIMLFNGKQISKEYYGDNIPEKPFGKYRIINRFETKEYIFFLADECDYFVQTNIKTGEVYDLGIKINFNGEAYLNNQKIESGTAIDVPGHYLLEIRSPEESVAFVFEVAKLSETDADDETEEKEFLEAGALSVKPPAEKRGFAEIKVNKEEKNENYRLPSLFIGVLLGVVSGFIVIKINRRKKNA